MQHLGTKALETDRLILRQFIINDARATFNNWSNDPDVTKYLTWAPHSNVDVSKSVLEGWITSYEKDNFYQWGIVIKSTDELVGTISIVQQKDDIKMVQVGYCIGKKWWKQGITSEALAAIIRFFFEEVGINRLEARHDPRNPNSGKVMTKCGLKYEGTMRQADINNQGICDASYYAILAEDYLGRSSQ